MTLPGTPLAQVTADKGMPARESVLFYTSATAATLQMTINDRTYNLTTSGAALAVTLPSVAEAAGMMFFIYFISKDSSYSITVDDKGDDIPFSQLTIDTEDDAFILISDGIHWYAMNASATT